MHADIFKPQQDFHFFINNEMVAFVMSKKCYIDARMLPNCKFFDTEKALENYIDNYYQDDDMMGPCDAQCFVNVDKLLMNREALVSAKLIETIKYEDFEKYGWPF